MRALLLASCAVAALLHAAAWANEPPQQSPANAKADDPLLRAIEELRGEVESLRKEMREARGRPVAASSANVKLPPPREPFDHWSFKPLAKPALPAVKQTDWIKDDLDRFILARLETGRPEAEPGGGSTHARCAGSPST